METRYSIHPEHLKQMDTEELREKFLVESIFVLDEIILTYTHDDRLIFGGVMPATKELELSTLDELRSEYFLQRRELGIINIGDTGIVTVDGVEYIVENKEAVYVTMGSREVKFKSADGKQAKFYINSSPAHHRYETKLISYAEAKHIKMGEESTMNKRVIHQLIHPDVIDTCQLGMGVTELAVGSGWNTMPCHTHDRRMEVYLYFDLDESQRVFHMHGQPQETRHIVMANEQAVISPSWSIHSGIGTSNYSFVWGMCGENQQYDDMDHVAIKDLK